MSTLYGREGRGGGARARRKQDGDEPRGERLRRCAVRGRGGPRGGLERAAGEVCEQRLDEWGVEARRVEHQQRRSHGHL